MKTIELREHFIKYFRDNKHRFIKPSKVFNDDPTLFFVNSGMCQLKDVFLGKIESQNQQLTNSQICIRAGGKHNDFDDVGKDSYHLTSFEMLGNWSINTYWKEEAIKLAFDYLIKCGLDKNRMYATYFEGSEKIPEDLESKEIWKKYLPENHIVPGSFKDNFWMMALNGPCGACTEIHYDLETNRTDVSNLVNKDDPSLIEIWNIVFMEYNAINDNFTKLERRFVDTGLGMNRLAMVLQNKKSIYQTDVFQKILLYVQILSNFKTYEDVYDENKTNIAFRIFADHIRTVVIALFDGVRFDCHGRGFILRKIFRRLLMNYYVYLNDCEVKPITSQHVLKALISDILDYYLFKKHDVEELINLLHEEEMLYVSKINNVKRVYDSKMSSKSKKSKEEVIIEMTNSDMKSVHGIDQDIIDVIDKIKIVN